MEFETTDQVQTFQVPQTLLYDQAPVRINEKQRIDEKILEGRK